MIAKGTSLRIQSPFSGAGRLTLLVTSAVVADLKSRVTEPAEVALVPTRAQVGQKPRNESRGVVSSVGSNFGPMTQRAVIDFQRFKKLARALRISTKVRQTDTRF